MKVLAVFNSKGGSGKSTIAMHIAVAAAEQLRVAILDVDPNATTTEWGRARESDTPHVEQSSAFKLKADIERMRTAGADLVVLDCPPSITAESAFLVSCADFVVVPVQPTMPDVAGCFKATKIIDAQKKPYAFILNRCPPPSIETQQAEEGLSQSGPLCPISIGDRIAFSRALASGVAVTEMMRKGKAFDETMAVSAWILEKIGATNGK